jgi:hypothetical protein
MPRECRKNPRRLGRPRSSSRREVLSDQGTRHAILGGQVRQVFEATPGLFAQASP